MCRPVRNVEVIVDSLLEGRSEFVAGRSSGVLHPLSDGAPLTRSYARNEGTLIFACSSDHCGRHVLLWYSSTRRTITYAHVSMMEITSRLDDDQRLNAGRHSFAFFGPPEEPFVCMFRHQRHYSYVAQSSLSLTAVVTQTRKHEALLRS